MKKRWVALLTAVCLVAAPMSALAEDILKDTPEIENFSLHSGVMFGDSKTEVKAKEKEAGFQCTDGEKDGLSDRVFVSGMFAGISSSTLSYDFYGEDGVYSASYAFSDDQSYQLDAQADDFSSITEELIKKYGDPIFDGTEEGGVPIYLWTYKNNEMVTGWGVYNFMRQVFSADDLKIYGYNQWLINAGDAYVLIDHYLSGTWFSSSAKWLYEHTLSYTCLDEETAINELNSSLDSQKEKEKSKNDDL